ncbi:TetR/AcrR family transcriptional regulator [Mycolicibacterium arenosum]|uniref:TetR/AcrR family transcriptional regulator n=1 Tax=Mycolicibacterium arenosum TaxID=2952157 RepID=A0ABT1LXF0_9MYCO|nr:TetR/AcrR family transcriptional regulator [Mycolicibacterium sp. CAU 1645]MCP9271020.1 TetR/AcrR family transcriptional regulator [Mycolicibacterium sp. CAU 1645]
MAGDWLAERRVEVAADRILDAAEKLFATHDAATVGMNEIARAAGCSRATLYRYFENRDALYTAYVHREAYRVFSGLGERLDAAAPSAVRLIDGIVESLRLVRESPALSSWFAPSQRPIGGEMAERSEVIRGLTEAYLRALGMSDVERLARWLVRVLISLLTFPGHDAGDERAMLEEFVLPLMSPAAR